MGSEIERDQRLARRYYTSELGGSLGGAQALSKEEKKVPHKKITEWLSYEDPYTLHAPRRLTFPRNKMFASTINDTYQVDLCDLQKLSRYNSGYKYIMTMIDVFSRFLWAVPLKNKTGIVVAKVLNDIFSKGSVPLKLNSDKGGEFKNAHVTKVLKKFKIKFYTTDSDKKASMVERVNRTLKNRMWRFFSKAQSYRYVEELPNLVKGYNNTVHRIVGIAPAKINLHNEEKVWSYLNRKKGNVKKKKQPTFATGDLVRVSNPKKVFEKGYKGLWSKEIFVIEKSIPRDPVVYRLKDRNNEEITGVFYEPELQLVREHQLPEEVYLIDRILKRQKRKGKLYLKVLWKNYKDPSWIPAENLVTP